MKINIFWPGWGGAQEGPQEGKCTKRSPWKSFLATRICCKKRGLDDSPAQNPVFLRAFSCPCFQNPIFCMLFEKNLQPGLRSRQALARPNQARTTAKTQGFENLLIKTLVKNQGSATVECANIVFCGVFLSLT